MVDIDPTIVVLSLREELRNHIANMLLTAGGALRHRDSSCYKPLTL